MLLIGWVFCLPGGAQAAKVPALKGDGIYSLLRRHGLDPEANVAEFVRLNRSELGPGNILYAGRSYTLPDRSSVVIEPLFGKGQERVEVKDRQLQGAVFYLISGHGGPDPGGQSSLNGKPLYEDEYAYDVTLRLGRALLQHGAKVTFIVRDPNDGIRDGQFLTPDRDELHYPGKRIPESQLDRLEARSAAVNGLARKQSAAVYQRCISVHVDARMKGQDIDIFFYYQQGGKLSKRLAEAMRTTIRSKYRQFQPGRGYEGSVTTRGLYVLNHINVPMVFIELGNIHHPRDRERLMEASNRQAVANWLAEAIVADFKKGG